MLTVVGRDGSTLGEAALAALQGADLVVGEARLLDGLPTAPGARRVAGTDFTDALRSVDVSEQDVVLVVDGDPGHFGVLRELLEEGHAPETLPATPLVARAFSEAGLPWDDALVVSARDGHLRQAVNACRAHPKVAVLTGPDAGPAELARALFPVTPRSFVVCEDLGGPKERVVYVRPAEATTRPWNDPQVVLVLDNRHALGQSTWVSGPAQPSAGWALPADAFGEGPGLPPEVRAFVLARLGPRIGDMVWDVESGDGSVAVECARFGAAVVAVERANARCERIKENIRLHGVKAAMASGDVRLAARYLPKPDAVFVGPGFTGRNLPEAVSACAEFAPSRLVATPAGDEIRATLDVLAGQGYTTGAVRLHATPLDPQGEPATPEPPEAPVVVWGERNPEVPGRRRARKARPIETVPALPGEPEEPRTGA